MKAKLKCGLYLLSFSILVSLMASCLGNNNNYNDEISFTDAELLSFGLQHDSVPNLVKVVFAIDQRGEIGSIYNYDSMAYRTEITSKVIVNYTSATGTDNVLNITNNDSTWVKSGDSIDISQPLILKVFALDGKTTKRYNVQLNIHQVNPDSIQYQKIASDLPFLQTEDTKTVEFNNRFLTYSKFSLPPTTGYNSVIQLHSSSDVVNWTQEVSGLPVNAVIKGIQSKGDRLFAYTEDGELYTRYDLTVDEWMLINKPASIKIKSILGYLNTSQKQEGGLSLVVETEGKYVFAFAFTKDFSQWEYDSTTPVPDDFPLSDFSNYSYQLMYTGRISIFGGVSLNGVVQNAVWSTENGRYWAKLTGSANRFPPLQGANVFYYNNEFWLISGKSNDGFNMYYYYSNDGGVTWKIRMDKENNLPVAYYIPRYNASVVMDKERKHYYIIGGKYDGVFSDVWKGFLNKMEFEH